MSLLHTNTPDATDDAALGEEFTKGSSHLVIAALLAAITVSLAIAIYFLAGHKPPISSGEILAVWVAPRHTQTSGFDANGDPAPVETYDQVLVFAKARVKNQSPHPLTLSGILANTKLPDGIHSSYAAPVAEYDRVFAVYPGLQVPHEKGLGADVTLAPGASVEGTFVSIFSMTREQWNTHTGLDFTFAFRYQPSLQLTPQVPIQER